MPVKSGFLRVLVVLSLSPSGKCDQGNRLTARQCAQMLGSFDPAHPRHPQIQKYDLRSPAFCGLDSLVTIVSGRNFMRSIRVNRDLRSPILTEML